MAANGQPSYIQGMTPASAYVEKPPPYFSDRQQNNAVSAVPQPGIPVVLAYRTTTNLRSQIPSTIYPGLAFCKFTPGIIETIIRTSLLVVLVALIAVSGVAIHEEGKIDSFDAVYVNGTVTPTVPTYTGWRGIAEWIIFVAILSLVTEVIMILLHFLNPSCFNNRYGIFGGLDIAKCILAGISLFSSCIVTGTQSTMAAEDLNYYCDYTDSDPDYDEDCRQLQIIYRLVITLTVVNALCLTLLLVLFVWDIIYLGSNYKSKIPVPRISDHQR